MTPAAAKGEKLFLLAAALLAAAAAVLAPASAEASRYLPQALEPVSAPPASLEDLAAGAADHPALPALTTPDRLDLVDLAAGARLEAQSLGLHLASGELGTVWKTASGGQTWALEDNVRPISEMGVKTRRVTFQGLWTDPVTGLAYARARWYDARNASWLSEDPLLDVDSPNLYAFVGWGPHMATDPMGECGPACVQVAGWLWGHRQDVAGTAASVAGAVAGVGVAAGEVVAAPVTMAATESANTYYGAARVIDAYQAGGLGQAYQEAQRVGRESSAENKQRLLGMIPGVNTYRQASRIADVYETQGPFAGGMQVGRTTFSLGLDATIVYSATSGVRAAVRPSTPTTSAPRVNLLNTKVASNATVPELQAIAETNASGPGSWALVNEAMSERAATYQTQISGRPPGQAYVVEDVKFDVFTGGALGEAKGPGYATFVENGRFRPWFGGAEDLVDQAMRQLAVSGSRPIVWSVAEEEAAAAIRSLLAQRGLGQITVQHVPPAVSP